MKLVNKAVYLEDEKILVITDLHIGYEENLNLGVREQYERMIQDLEDIFEEIKLVKEIIILGDLKHKFSRNNNQEWNEIRRLFSFLREKIGNNKISLIKGNHDNFIETIASKYDIETREFYIKNDKAFFHGDKQYIELLDKKTKYWFLGHLHPAILLQEDAKREIYKCFLVGKYKNKKVVILPSFFPLVEGSDVLKEDTNLAYDFDLENFEVYIPDGNKVLDFGKLEKVGELN